MDLFTPTLDWGSELTTSLWWIAKAWLIAAVSTLVVLVAIGRFTVWGRQFWRITGGYFVGRASIKVWLWLAALLLSVITGVRLTVLFSYQSNDLMTSFQVVASGLAGHNQEVKDSGAHGFWMSIGIFSLLALLHVGRIMLDLFMTQRFILRWRAWLTDQLTGDWLDGKAYYRSRFIDDTIDNPDQRLSEDTTEYVRLMIKLTLGFIGNLGTLLRLDAGQWQSLSSRVTTSSLSGVWARNPGEVYVTGSDGLIMRRSGTAAQGTWATVASGVTTSALNAVTGWSQSPTSGEAEVYAVGASGTIVHKAGTTWTIDGGFLTTQDLTGVWTGPDSVYVIGRGGRIYHKLKGTWSIELGPMGVPVNNDLFGVWGTGSGNGEVVYIAGDQGLLLRHDMLGWTQEAPTLTTESLVALYGTNEDNLLAFGNKGGVFQRLAGKWQPVANSPYGRGANGIAGCVIPGTQELLTMGDQGIIARKVGPSWPVEPLLTMQPYNGISAAARNDYYIVGNNGLILHKY